MDFDKAQLYLGVLRCEFDDECEYCDAPEQGSYGSFSPYGETNFYICGKCIIPEAEKKAEADDEFYKHMMSTCEKCDKKKYDCQCQLQEGDRE